MLAQALAGPPNWLQIAVQQPQSSLFPAGMGEVCDAYFRGLFQKIPNQPGVTVFQHIVALLRHADLARRKSLILTGHSLGSALAVVCAQSLHSWWVLPGYALAPSSWSAAHSPCRDRNGKVATAECAEGHRSGCSQM